MVRMDTRWIARKRPVTFSNPRALNAYLRGIVSLRRYGRAA